MVGEGRYCRALELIGKAPMNMERDNAMAVSRLVSQMARDRAFPARLLADTTYSSTGKAVVLADALTNMSCVGQYAEARIPWDHLYRILYLTEKHFGQLVVPINSSAECSLGGSVLLTIAHYAGVYGGEGVISQNESIRIAEECLQAVCSRYGKQKVRVCSIYIYGSGRGDSHGALYDIELQFKKGDIASGCRRAQRALHRYAKDKDYAFAAGKHFEVGVADILSRHDTPRVLPLLREIYRTSRQEESRAYALMSMGDVQWKLAQGPRFRNLKCILRGRYWYGQCKSTMEKLLVEFRYTCQYCNEHDGIRYYGQSAFNRLLSVNGDWGWLTWNEHTDQKERQALLDRAHQYVKDVCDHAKAHYPHMVASSGAYDRLMREMLNELGMH